ncbi:sigma factor-like helix-turn-helix DNA-binding protein [Streptomyces aquilus]|uniref:sigma factor-like helix-turn-helix DNA-binding protein n=1 Tax=Streptomyces aquilus TaxID=2548456 RepID=UPI0037D81788
MSRTKDPDELDTWLRYDPAVTTAAALSLLERLSPLQRAVFVLRQVFDCAPARTAAVVGCSEATYHHITTAVSRATGTDGRLPSWPPHIAGADHVARALAAIVPALTGVGITMEPHQAGHHQGAVFRDHDGQAIGALDLDILDGRISRIRWVKELKRQPEQASCATASPGHQAPGPNSRHSPGSCG